MTDTFAADSVPIDALPPFFQGLRVICPASEEIKNNRAKFQACSAREEIKCQVNSVTTPKLYMSQRIKRIYQSNNFGEIKRLEEQSQKDLQSVYEKIEKYGAGAWNKVEKDGREYYMCWSSSGCIWSCVQNTNFDGKDPKYEAVVQVGTYSKSSGIFTSHEYSVIITTMLAEATISALLAFAISKTIQAGIEFLVSRFAVNIRQ